MTFRIITPEELEPAKQEIQEAFFSGDRAEIDAHFEGYEDGFSTSILGYEDGRLVGIVTIRWESGYPPFRTQQIPLIQNIEIRYEDRGRGIGGQMLERAEQEIAQRSPLAGLCVGIFDAYGLAQHLYSKRGFVLDGRGVCRNHTPLTQGQHITVDHDLLLWLIKDVSGMTRSGHREN